jgi:hypothetical protein
MNSTPNAQLDDDMPCARKIFDETSAHYGALLLVAI